MKFSSVEINVIESTLKDTLSKGKWVKRRAMVTKLHYILTLFVSCLMLIAFMARPAIAQEKAPVYIGPFDVTPSIDIDVGKDDNLFESVSGEEVSSTLTQVRPSFSAVADDGIRTYTIEYELEDATYSDTNNNDYTDQELSASLAWRIDVRHLLELSTSIDKGHDERNNDSVTDVNVDDLNEFTDKNFSANYTFGSEGARGRFVIGFESRSLRYSTNLAETSVLESDTETINVNLSLGVTPSTRLTFQVIDADNTFNNNPEDDRNSLSYLVGAQWELTDTTKGNVSFGQTENDLVNVPGGVTSTATWAASLEWQQQEYSMFTLSANRSAQNTDNNEGSFIDATQIMVDWNYLWNDQLSMRLSLGHQNDDFIDADRNDDTNTVNLEFVYAIRRWLNISLGVGNEQRESTDPQNEYDKNTATLSLKANL